MLPLTFEYTATQNGIYKCDPLGDENGVALYRVQMRWTEEKPPAPVTLRFSLPVPDSYSVFDCRRFDRAKNWGGVERASRLSSDLPLLQLISKDGSNRYVITLSDVKTPVKIRISCEYQTMTSLVEISFFTALTAPRDAYRCFLRIDTRRLPFYDALADARVWFSSLGFAPAVTPPAAEAPVYSTWYSYLTEVTAADVLKECAEAKRYGMDTVIIDDGWQRENGESIYGYCGDWAPNPEKFPDMAGLTRQLHAMGMRVMLWYSVPFVGEYSKNYDHFAGKYLRTVPGCDCAVLDPRYKEVRDFLVGTYARAVKDWSLDGLKLDFIDRFAANGEVTAEMDHVSVEDATEALLSEIYTALTAIRPDILLEFRQPYSGPVIGAYGNMLRVWDCPNDGLTNRVSSLNLRLTSDVCVHSDMVRWCADETPEQTAALLWGTLFCVPQISVRMEALTRPQKMVLRRFLGFWRAHKHTLLHGKLTAQSPESLFAYAAAVTDEETVALCAAQNYADLTGAKRAYVCNLTATETLALKTAAGARIRIYDCFGECVEETVAATGLTAATVPLGGMAEAYTE